MIYECLLGFNICINIVILVLIIVHCFGKESFVSSKLTSKQEMKKELKQEMKKEMKRPSVTKFSGKYLEDYIKTIFDDKERIKYYLGNLTGPMYITLYDKNFKTDNTYIIDSYFFDKENKIANPTIKNYVDEMEVYYDSFKKEYTNVSDKKFILVTGDVSHTRTDIAFLCKTRPIENKGKTVLLPLNNIRHWKPIHDVKAYDIPYDEKKNKIVWRGASTGKDIRSFIVEKYYNYPGHEIDIGFTDFMEYYSGDKNPKYLKKSMTMGEMLQNKFLISLEGNDVASNLKWVLASNSLCIMPPPKIESWLMEGLLIPWVHYVPLDDNLPDIYDWCLKNPEACKEIVGNANVFVGKFMDGANEFKIITGVLKGYANNVTIF